MSDSLLTALVALLAAITALIKQTIQHNNNKARITALLAYVCGKAPTCPDKTPLPIDVTPPTV